MLLLACYMRHKTCKFANKMISYQVLSKEGEKHEVLLNKHFTYKQINIENENANKQRDRSYGSWQRGISYAS